MSPKDRFFLRSHVLSLGILLLVLGAFFADPAQAQEETPPPDSGCLTCHDNLYYLYDTGKWFCLCGTEMTCTCCHGGNPDALMGEDAHLGMVLYPTRNDAKPCQQCHPDDYEARVERFSEIAGVSPIHSLPPTPTIPEPTSVGDGTAGLASGAQSRWLEPWRLAGLVALALALAVLVFFGYRCWKADSLARRSKSIHT